MPKPRQIRKTRNGGDDWGEEFRNKKAPLAYHPKCDNCDKSFWSEEAFPDPHICKKCETKRNKSG